jgi:MFS family permease
MLHALRIRDFRLLWSARLVSSLGSWLLVIAIPAHVFVMTGSVMATGLTVAAEYLPSVVLGPIAGVVADRWDRRRVMVAADVFRAVAVALMLAARTPDTVWVIYAGLVAESAGTALFRPAAQAHMPVVVGTGPLLSSANSLNAFADGTVRLVGGPLGAVLLIVTGYEVLILADVASYLVSAAAIVLTSSHTHSGKHAANLVADLAEGWRALSGERFVRALLPVTMVFLGANASLSALLIPFGLGYLGGGEQLGFVLSAVGVGFLLGAPLSRVLVDRLELKYVLGASMTVTAAAFYVFFHSPLPTALPAGVVLGTAGSIALVTPTIALQRILPNAVLGRVSAVFLSAEAIATLTGAMLGPMFAQTAGLPTAATIASVVTLVAGLVCVLLPQTRSGAAISAGNGYGRSAGNNSVASSSEPA